MRLSVVILYNEPVLDAGHPDAESERAVLETVDAVHQALIGAGFDVGRLGVGLEPRTLLDGLARLRPDVVFNLFEGLASSGETEAHVAGLLSWLDIPHTGSPYHTLCLARSKHLTKRLLQGAGLPTPKYFVVDSLPVLAHALNWPVIVKPAQHDASVGLDQGSVVTNHEALERRVARLLEAYGPPVLVEELIRGRELNVSVVETPEVRVLPVSEVLFVDDDPAYWPIVTYDAKWTPESRDYRATPTRYPAEVSPQLGERLGLLARQAFGELGCRDYARVDFRVGPGDEPFILEVNPNPDFHPTAGLAGGLKSAGISHEQFAIDLVRRATRRAPRMAASSADAHFDEREALVSR